jgi:hypothetical protein
VSLNESQSSINTVNTSIPYSNNLEIIAEQLKNQFSK